MMQPGCTGGFGVYQRDGPAQDARGVEHHDGHAGFPHSLLEQLIGKCQVDFRTGNNSARTCDRNIWI